MARARSEVRFASTAARQSDCDRRAIRVRHVGCRAPETAWRAPSVSLRSRPALTRDAGFVCNAAVSPRRTARRWNPSPNARSSSREIVVTRTFDAPARIVFQAWTTPALFKRWWVPKVDAAHPALLRGGYPCWRQLAPRIRRRRHEDDGLLRQVPRSDTVLVKGAPRRAGFALQLQARSRTKPSHSCGAVLGSMTGVCIGNERGQRGVVSGHMPASSQL